MVEWLNEWLRQCLPRALKNDDADDDDPDALDDGRRRGTVEEAQRATVAPARVVVERAGWTVDDAEEEESKTDG